MSASDVTPVDTPLKLYPVFLALHKPSSDLSLLFIVLSVSRSAVFSDIFEDKIAAPRRVVTPDP